VAFPPFHKSSSARSYCLTPANLEDTVKMVVHVCIKLTSG